MVVSTTAAIIVATVQRARFALRRIVKAQVDGLSSAVGLPIWTAVIDRQSRLGSAAWTTVALPARRI